MVSVGFPYLSIDNIVILILFFFLENKILN